MSTIELKGVESSQISAIGYDAASKTMAIQFRGKDGPGSTYHYSNVEADDFAALRDAKSIGSHFFKNIKPFPDRFPCTLVDWNRPASKET